MRLDQVDDALLDVGPDASCSRGWPYRVRAPAPTGRTSWPRAGRRSSSAPARTGIAPPPPAGRTVADSPIRCAGLSSSWSSRSSESARCAPRLVAATACTSSTMTVCTAASVSRAADVSIRNSDSGVVIRMSGGLAMSSRRRSGGVSPERTPTLISGAGSPRRSAMRVMPVSGVRRLRSTSTASAFSGDTYRTRVPAAGGRGSARPAGRWPTGTRPASFRTRSAR